MRPHPAHCWQKRWPAPRMGRPSARGRPKSIGHRKDQSPKNRIFYLPQVLPAVNDAAPLQQGERAQQRNQQEGFGPELPPK